MFKIATGGIIVLALVLGGLVLASKTPSPSAQVEGYSTDSLSTLPTLPESIPAPTDEISANITPTPMATPSLSIDPAKTYTAEVKTTAGDLTIELSSKTPITTNNFVTLAQKGFYNNTIFHRVISGFMIQGGDPTGTGAGGPGYKFADEPFEGEYTRGTVAMANAGPNTNGSQFFIMHADYPLPKNYVIFGHVTTGLETVDKIATAPVTSSPSGENSKPVDPVKILSVSISEK